MQRSVGYNFGFIFLAIIASLALAILYFFMPETGKMKISE